MNRKVVFGSLAILAILALATGCHKQATPGTAPVGATPGVAAGSYGYFKTPFQSESQFIVEAIVTDLAEQMYYTAHHQLPDPKYFSVVARERGGSPTDAPIYDLQINLDQQHAGLKQELDVNGPIWSPAVYNEMTAALAKAVGVSPVNARGADDLSLVSELTDGTPETIERQNRLISDGLEKSFADAEAHENAALLLGAFMLREHSGFFFEIRSPLCRLTSHLAMAHFLSGEENFGINGRLAEATMLSVVNAEQPALKILDSISSQDPSVQSMVRALRMRNTGDFRLAAKAGSRTPMESLAWFAAMADYGSTVVAWGKLDDAQKQTIGYVRVANELNSSVEMGHQLTAEAIPLEAAELQSIYERTQSKKLAETEVVKVLNQMPERCFSDGPDGKTHVRIIGWGQWAAFFQRHLCHAVQQTFEFINERWGLPDDAKEFAARCDKNFDGLRLYPFVRRFDCTDVESYHKAVDDGFKVTVDTPQLVPAECWNYLCYRVRFAPKYDPNPNPHINEWHDHNPPPGTAYDLNPRLNHPSLVDRSDAVAKFEQLHELSPYDLRISNFLLEKKFGDHPTYEQSMSLFKPMLPWSRGAMFLVASTVRDQQPEQYEKLMLQAAELSPALYFELGDYALQHKDEDKAAQYYDQGADADPDAVSVASYAIWRVRYALKKGQTAKARQIADFAGEVYSETGLEAKAIYYEATGDYNNAFQWFANVEERYNHSGPLIAFCQRYKAKTGSSRFDAELKKRVSSVFPSGVQKVSLKDFRSPPTDGVLFPEENDLMIDAGLRAGNIVVAIGGTRVHSTEQFAFIRDTQESSELDLIVWQGSGYKEIKTSPPDRHFGVDIKTYGTK